MSRSYYVTPEEMLRKKQRNKSLLYASFIALSMVISALVSILANQI
ncbi:MULTISPECIES: hypothetical protein [unclassified Bacillus (in: firmicutes)]|nr:MULTISPECIES: hypothetical protein [unclassified Bacillus (in: firmicutes)]